MHSPQTRFYRDWDFWAVVLSLAAITLSQLPPLQTLLRSQRLDVGIYNKVILSHNIGNSSIGMALNLRNNGVREIIVDSIEVHVHKGNAQAVILPVSDYFPDLISEKSVVFVPFVIKPGEQWFHGVVSYRQLDRLAYKNLRENIEALKFNLNQKIAKEKSAPRPALPVTADEQFVAPFYYMQRALFFWTPAEYSFEVYVKSGANTYSSKNKYQFNVFDSESASLVAYEQYYKYGGILTYEIADAKGMTIPIYPLPGAADTEKGSAPK
jgi:hypothetical protein